MFLRVNKLLNNHSKLWSNILNIGKNSGNNQPDRIKDALKVTDSDVPPMKGMRKDHKVSTDKLLGPPCRPLSNASIGPNSNLANLMTRVLQPVKKKLNSRLGTEIVSTEELLRKVSDLNSLNKPSLRRLPRSSKLPDIQSDKRTISSMDVAASYPSCKMDPTSKNIEVAIKQCGLVFKEIDTKYLSQFIAVINDGFVTPDIKRPLPEAKQRTTLNSFVTNPKPSQFCSDAEVPPENISDIEVRKLLALGVSKAIKTVMGNHFFKIGGKMYKQTDGGSIGLDLTVELASIYMTLWDERFMKKCKNMDLKIDLYTRYVDDIKF